MRIKLWNNWSCDRLLHSKSSQTLFKNLVYLKSSQKGRKPNLLRSTTIRFYTIFYQHCGILSLYVFVTVNQGSYSVLNPWKCLENGDKVWKKCKKSWVFFISEKFFVLVKSYSILLYTFAVHHEKAVFLRSLFDKKKLLAKKNYYSGIYSSQYL